MQTPLPVSIKKWIFISAAIGYVALAIYLFYFVGIFDLVQTIQKVNLGIYLIAILAVIISITLHTLVWFNLLNFVNIKLSFRRTYVLYWLGIFEDNLTVS